MSTLEETAPAFVAMAHRIVWCSAATTDPRGRPWSRILHPFWVWDGASLVGWVATSPTPIKRAHLAHSPNMSFCYFSPNQDTCSAECEVEWAFDDDTRRMVWDQFVNAPPPVGYDPAIIPQWAGGPTSDAFAALRLQPWRLRVLDGEALIAGRAAVLEWRT